MIECIGFVFLQVISVVIQSFHFAQLSYQSSCLLYFKKQSDKYDCKEFEAFTFNFTKDTPALEDPCISFTKGQGDNYLVAAIFYFQTIYVYLNLTLNGAEIYQEVSTCIML